MAHAGDKFTSIKADLEMLLPRLNKFALALAGTADGGSELLRATCRAVLTRAAKEKGQTPLALWALTQMHTLWVARLNGGANQRREADVELFQGAAAGMGRFIAHLPPQQRATLTLIYGFGLSYDEAAEIFGVPVSTVMTRVVRGHNVLARWLDHRGQNGGNRDVYEEQAA